MFLSGVFKFLNVVSRTSQGGKPYTLVYLLSEDNMPCQFFVGKEYCTESFLNALGELQAGDVIVVAFNCYAKNGLYGLTIKSFEDFKEV